MKLITRDTDYAIRALCYIAKKGESIASVNDLVVCLKMPRAFLRKILQRLNNGRVLKSYKGRGGGFSLSKAPDKIHIMDLIEIFQGPLSLQEHVFSGRPCPEIKKCLFKKKLDVIEKHIISNLSSITLESLLDKNAR